MGEAEEGEMRGKFNKKVSDSDLALFRADPGREGLLGITDYVVCRECGTQFVYLHGSTGGHLSRQHQMSDKQYRHKWPGAPTVAAKALGRLKEQHRKAQTSFRARNPRKVKLYSKQWWRDHLERETKTDLRLYQTGVKSEEKLGITDYIVCRECGVHLKSLSRHALLQHGMKNYKYRTKWPDAPRASLEEHKRLSATIKKLRATVLPFPTQSPPMKAPQPKSETEAKIDLAGRLKAEGYTQSRMRFILFPNQEHSPEAAYANTRKLFSDHRAAIEAAKNRYLLRNKAI
jgi:predicted transcriptional regulator